MKQRYFVIAVQMNGRMRLGARADETQKASRKPWSDVPEANKITMRAAVTALLEELSVGLSEWQCPACGAVTRARMSDHDKER